MAITSRFEKEITLQLYARQLLQQKQRVQWLFCASGPNKIVWRSESEDSKSDFPVTPTPRR
jgi:hypothetical protein